jgi:hypothetical protein
MGLGGKRKVIYGLQSLTGKILSLKELRPVACGVSTPHGGTMIRQIERGAQGQTSQWAVESLLTRWAEMAWEGAGVCCGRTLATRECPVAKSGILVKSHDLKESFEATGRQIIIGIRHGQSAPIGTVNKDLRNTTGCVNRQRGQPLQLWSPGCLRAESDLSTLSKRKRERRATSRSQTNRQSIWSVTTRWLTG